MILYKSQQEESKMKKTKNKELFTVKDIAVACPEKMVWDEMDVVGEGKRLCEGCDKVLVDVTGYTKEEVEELQKKDPTICVAVGHALIASTLSFSLLSAGGDIGEINATVPYEVYEENALSEDTVIVEAVGSPVPPPEEVPHVVLGLPARPTCSTGTVILNNIKRFFGLKADTSCWEED